ncbi:MAG: hypothetical protein D4R64_08995 [Porphyromonadaceae bacterium]|nr:MAG: hypothetical protein D4R64_08995 [Porphyromonadaceae bacterium]
MNVKSGLLAIFLAAILIAACAREDVPDDNGGIEAKPTGTLRVLFKISHPWIPVNRIVRAELHVAKDAMEIYKGNFIQSANVTSFQDTYFFYLDPGTYYYEAVIACICGGDSCSAGGFPGNKWGTKHTMGKFDIKEDEVTQVIPLFQ